MSKVSSPPILNRESMPDAPEGEWLDRILDYGNSFNDQVARALRNGVTLSDNTPYKTQSYILKHGVETEITPPLARGLTCKGVSVLQCEGVEVDATTQKPTGKIYSLGLSGQLQWRPSGKPSGSIYVTANYAGNVGEQIRNYISTPVNAPGTGTNYSVGSIDLTPGTWDVNALCVGEANGATVQGFIANINTAISLGSFGDNRADTGPPNASYNVFVSIPQYRLTVTTTTTVYLVGRFAYSAGTPRAQGRISAVRITIDQATTGRLNLLFYGE